MSFLHLTVAVEHTFNHYSAKAPVISPNTYPTRPKAESAKIRPDITLV